MPGHFAGIVPAKTPGYTRKLLPGMLPVSSISPLILPQTSSHQTQGDSRVARMEHQTHSGFPRIPETQSAGTLWFPSGLPETLCSGRNNYYRRTGNLMNRSYAGVKIRDVPRVGARRAGVGSPRAPPPRPLPLPPPHFPLCAPAPARRGPCGARALRNASGL